MIHLFPSSKYVCQIRLNVWLILEITHYILLVTCYLISLSGLMSMLNSYVDSLVPRKMLQGRDILVQMYQTAMTIYLHTCFYYIVMPIWEHLKYVDIEICWWLPCDVLLKLVSLLRCTHIWYPFTFNLYNVSYIFMLHNNTIHVQIHFIAFS